MNEFIYLFPVYEFAKVLVGESRWNSGERERKYQGLAKRIKTQYRQTGYRINWLLFSKVRDTSRPDISITAQELLAPGDRLALAGITFQDLTIRNLYPDTGFILSQLTPTPENLVIAGFHLWDCVDRLASAAHAAGISTKVAEDLTELFFLGHEEVDIPERFIALGRHNRQNRPWLTQA